jgi:hypothetical protein
MTNIDPATAGQRPLTKDLLFAARYYLGTRTGIVLSVAAILGAGAYFNWGWLVALGLAPLILGVLPCAAMCALGLCMGGRSKSPADDVAQSDESNPAASGAAPLKLVSADGKIEVEGKSNRSGKSCC